MRKLGIAFINGVLAGALVILILKIIPNFQSLGLASQVKVYGLVIVLFLVGLLLASKKG